MYVNGTHIIWAFIDSNINIYERWFWFVCSEKVVASDQPWMVGALYHQQIFMDGILETNAVSYIFWGRRMCDVRCAIRCERKAKPKPKQHWPTKSVPSLTMNHSYRIQNTNERLQTLAHQPPHHSHPSILVRIATSSHCFLHVFHSLTRPNIHTCTTHAPCPMSIYNHITVAPLKTTIHRHSLSLYVYCRRV